MEKLFLVDAYAQIFRAYYAFMSRPMRNAEGLNTSAIFGFTKFLRDIIIAERPHYLGVAFDPHGGNFRNRLYPAYKANRTATPEDIVASVPYIKRIVEAMRIPILEVADYEADDVIGTLAKKAASAGFDVYMVTPDKDFGQLVEPHIRIYKQRKGGEGVEIVGMEQIRDHYGFDDPRKVIDILALWGDAADNIPGIQGVGEKGAIKLVGQYGTVEEILSSTDSLTGKQRDNIIAGADQLRLSKRLATIALDAPIAFVPSALAMEQPDCQALREIYNELGFNMFIREMEAPASPFSHQICPEASVNAAHPTAAPSDTQSKVQKDLFGNAVEAAAQKKGTSDTVENDLFSQPSTSDNIDTVPHDYRIADTPEKIAEAVADIAAARHFAFDTETTGFDYFGDRIVGIALAAEPHKAYYIPVDTTNQQAVMAALAPLFSNPDIDKIGQNIKFDMQMLLSAGIELQGRLWDTIILHYLVDPESRHNLDFLAERYLNYTPVAIESLIGRGAKQLSMERVPLEQIAPYCAEDADLTLQLWHKLLPEVRHVGEEELYGRIEEPLIPTLAEMERTGVRIDPVRLAEYGRLLTIDMAKIEEAIRSAANMPDLNINSSRQLGIALFEKLRIDPKPKRTKTKQYSTEEEYLQSLSDRNPIVGQILEYRGIKKLLSTYVEALPQLINPRTGRIHTSFNQAVTATGRLSSTNPNLQNIPVREELGRQIRKAFIPSDSDHVLLSADYSQVELRLMAHLSGDQNMIAAFRAEEDIHRDTASRLFHVELQKVTPEQRRKAKTANFGIIYGISAFGLRQRMGSAMSMGEAKEIIDGYFRSYPGVKNYIDRTIEQARVDGYVETIFGRRRYLPDIRSHNNNVRSLAERNAINAPLQGSAADIIKIAMNSVRRRFADEGITSKVILQVHDELVVDTLRSEVDRVKTILKESMEGAAQLQVPLTVDIGTGENWLEAH